MTGIAGVAAVSSYCTIGAAPRFNFILKSCFSSSNSEIEFYFIKSMIALISLRSTRSSGVGAIDNFLSQTVHLSKKSSTGSRHCFKHPKSA